jgi:hypothetical protein
VLVKALDPFLIAFVEHSRHEDFVLFPAVRGYFPSLNPEADKEHHEIEGK